MVVIQWPLKRASQRSLCGMGVWKLRGIGCAMFAFCGRSVYHNIIDIVHLSNSIQLLEWPYINISHFPWMAHSNNAVRHLRINWYRLTFMSMQHMISYNMLKPKWNGITFRVQDFPTPTLIICVNIYVMKYSMIILSSKPLPTLIMWHKEHMIMHCVTR